MSEILSRLYRSSSAPVTTLPGIPKESAMASAVSAWSPVIMMTLMPALWHSRIASRASARGGSIIACNPTKVRLCSGVLVFFVVANARTLSACCPNCLTWFAMSVLSVFSIVTVLPLSRMCVHFFRRTSGAPLMKAAFWWMVVIILRSLVNSISLMRGYMVESFSMESPALMALTSRAPSVGSPRTTESLSVALLLMAPMVSSKSRSFGWLENLPVVW